MNSNDNKHKQTSMNRSHYTSEKPSNCPYTLTHNFKAVKQVPASWVPAYWSGYQLRISGSTNMYLRIYQNNGKNIFLQQFRTLFFHKRRWIRCYAHDCLDELINAGQIPSQIISQVIKGRQQCSNHQPSCIHLIIKVCLQCSTKRRRRPGCPCRHRMNWLVNGCHVCKRHFIRCRAFASSSMTLV